MAKVLLNNVDHHDLRVITRHAAEFGDAVSQVPVFPTEFEDVQREYPIVFRKQANDEFQAVALLGLDRDENLYLDESGWHGRYVPAIRRRGPFLIGLGEPPREGEPAPEPMIHVDLDHPRISRSEGQPVFLPHGGNTPYLEHVAGVLRTIYSGIDMGKAMFAAFEEAGVIEPVRIEIKLSDSQEIVVPDVFTIGQGLLERLRGEPLDRLHASGFLGAAFLVVASLANVNRLVELKTLRSGAGRAA